MMKDDQVAVKQKNGCDDKKREQNNVHINPCEKLNILFLLLFD